MHRKDYLWCFISLVSEYHFHNRFPDSAETVDCSLFSAAHSWYTRPLFNPAADGYQRAAAALGLGWTLCLDSAVLHRHGARDRSWRKVLITVYVLFKYAYFLILELYFSTGNPGRGKGFCSLETIRLHCRTGRSALLTARRLEAALQCVFQAGTGPLYPQHLLAIHLRSCRVHWL